MVGTKVIICRPDRESEGLGVCIDARDVEGMCAIDETEGLQETTTPACAAQAVGIRQHRARPRCIATNNACLFARQPNYFEQSVFGFVHYMFYSIIV